jgi:hypothetical protein
MNKRDERNRGFATYEKVGAVLSNRLIHSIESCAPERPEPGEDRGGQWSVYPFWVYFVIKMMVHVFGSLRQVERELRKGNLWWRIRQAGHYWFPDAALLPEIPPSLDQINTWTARNFTTQSEEADGRDYSPAALKARLAAKATKHAVKLALAMGLFAEDRSGSFAFPALEKVLYGDGKVVTPKFRSKMGRRKRDPVTHDLKKVVADPDARLCVIGGGKRVFGVPWVFINARGEGWRKRVIFAFAHVAASDTAEHQGGEAFVAVRLFRSVLGHLPGCQAVLYDGAFHHKHGKHMFKWVPFTSRLSKAAHGRPNNRFYPYPVQVHLYHPRTVLDPVTDEIVANPAPDPKAVVMINDGSSSGPGALKVHLEWGLPYICQRTRRGPEHHVAFVLESVTRVAAPNYRWYALYRVPAQPWCPEGGWVRLRLDETEEDRRIDFKRCEYLRAIPGDVDDVNELELRRLYGLRGDAESGNATYDRSLPFYERAHSVGVEKQWLDNLTWQAYENSLARVVWARHWNFEEDDENHPAFESDDGYGLAPVLPEAA